MSENKMKIRDLLPDKLVNPWWKTLAAGLGDASSIEWARNMLDIVTIQKIVDGVDFYFFPHQGKIMYALNKSAPQDLLRALLTWPKPVEVKDNIYWERLWTEALGYLKRANLIKKDEANIPALQSLVSECWYEAPQSISWRDIASMLINGQLPRYANLSDRFAKSKIDIHTMTVNDFRTLPRNVVHLIKGRESKLRKDVLQALKEDLQVAFDRLYATDYVGMQHYVPWDIVSLDSEILFMCEVLIKLDPALLDKYEDLAARKFRGEDYLSEDLELLLILGARNKC